MLTQRDHQYAYLVIRIMLVLLDLPLALTAEIVYSMLVKNAMTEM